MSPETGPWPLVLHRVAADDEMTMMMTLLHPRSRRILMCLWITYCCCCCCPVSTALQTSSHSTSLFSQHRSTTLTVLFASSGASTATREAETTTDHADVNQSPARTLSRRAGETALSKVQWLGSRMTEPEVEMQRPPGTLQSHQYFGQPANDRGEVSSIFEMADDYETEPPLKKKEKVEGTGGTLYIPNAKKLQKKKSSSETKGKAGVGGPGHSRSRQYVLVAWCPPPPRCMKMNGF